MMFFSQRVHRSTTCEEIVPPSHGAKEILTQVKNKQFIDLFLKEQRKVVVNQGKTFPSSPTTRQLSSLATSLKPTQVKTSDREFTPSVLDDSYSSDGISSNLGQSGSTFVVDDGESVVGDNELHPLDFEVVSTCSSAVSRHASPGIPVSDWPSNWEEEWLSKDPDDDIVPESDDTVVHVGHNNLGFVMNNERQQNSSVMKRNISLKETERVRNPKTNRGNFVKSYSWRPSKYLASLSEDHRRTRHSGKPQTASVGNVYKKPWDMKDNRNKSRIRRNTLEYLCRAFSVDLIDSFTLDSLSKSDLLVLWKASEINLRRQLSEMALQKESLLMLVDKETKGTEASGTPNIHSSSEDTG
ncbi:uncharacterized protein LOC135471873 [Liolophura sinensis]|uniref:uncharacterized protein LOC135471873 n=1 Tax=Liolophura sinensis TaxID=3198878 RepID=UPI00315800BE